jgi:hypothetical protein
MGKRAVVRLAIALCFEFTCVHSFTFSTHSLSASKAAALRFAHCAPLAGKIKSSFGFDEEGEVYTWDLEVNHRQCSRKLALHLPYWCIVLSICAATGNVTCRAQGGVPLTKTAYQWDQSSTASTTERS